MIHLKTVASVRSIKSAFVGLGRLFEKDKTLQYWRIFMDLEKLEKDIINSITDTITHIKKQIYWEDISSFCLYTDESFMSLSLLFNTKLYFEKTRDNNHPLTNKYSPAEWFSETITENDDEYLYKNIAFSSVSSMMMEFSISDYFEDNKDRNNISETCINAMINCIKNDIFQKPESTIYLFMLSDNYHKENLLNWNKNLNTQSIRKEFFKWINEEL